MSSLKLLRKRLSQPWINNAFDPKCYSVQFEELLQVSEARNHFFKYLTNVANCGEIADFLNDYEQYKCEYQSKTIKKKVIFRKERHESEMQSNINYLHNNF